MRRSRSTDENTNEILASGLTIPEQRPPSRKRRRTFLESFQTMSLIKTSDNESDGGNSSCATGGSLNHTDDDGCVEDTDYDDESSMEQEDVVLTDQEKVHRAIMYQLATGKNPVKPVDVVRDRLEQMIRQSRLQAAVAQDDFHVEFQREGNTMMDVEPMEIKRSSSLPRNFDQFDGAPPIDIVEVPR